MPAKNRVTRKNHGANENAVSAVRDQVERERDDEQPAPAELVGLAPEVQRADDLAEQVHRARVADERGVDVQRLAAMRGELRIPPIALASPISTPSSTHVMPSATTTRQ